MTDTTEAIKRKLYGEPVQYSRVDKAELKAYRQEGWVLNSEPLPEPEPPDIEVLELQLSDAKRELEKAEAEANRIIGSARSREQNARVRLEQAKVAVDHHETIAIKETVERDKQNAISKVHKVLLEAKVPIPSRVLLQMASNENEARVIKETFVTDFHSVGRDEERDWLIVANKQAWLAGAGEREAEALKAKQDAVRARMAQQGGK